MKNIEILTKIGLTEQEALVYLSLLKSGLSPASKIAKDADIKRTTIYPTLKSIIKKGGATLHFKGSQRFYLAKNPQRLAEVFKHRVKTFEDIIPTLEILKSNNLDGGGLMFIESIDELKNFYEEILIDYKNKSYRIMGNTNIWEGIDSNYFINFRKRRAGANIKTKILLSSDSLDINPKDEKLLRDFKYLPEKFKFKSTMDIFDDKVLIINPTGTSLAVVIALPTMTDIFKSMFDMLWGIYTEK